MIGITLSSEQIRNAPPDVRRWIEREVMTSLSQQASPDDGGKPHGEHLATCSEQEVAAILSQIQGLLPAVNVLFEFGRQGASFGQPNVEMFRLMDVAHHVRLQNVGQVIACLEIINQAFARVCGDPEARFCALDREGHCFITVETQQNILRVWQKFVASQQFSFDRDAPPAATADSSNAISPGSEGGVLQAPPAVTNGNGAVAGS